ncbi:MAG: hypothetical protein NT022_09725, partial [Deltaproteobacteria bacterium]|nr:hypothetical protein [Deltaproteobacteria bacterium]
MVKSEMTLNKCNCWVASIVLLYAISVSNASAFGLNNSFPRDLGSHVSGQTVDSMDGVMCVFSSAGGVSTLSKYVGATSVVGLIGEEEASAITTGLKRIIKTTKETFGESFQMFKFLDELKLFKDLELLKFLKIEARIDPG